MTGNAFLAFLQSSAWYRMTADVLFGLTWTTFADRMLYRPLAEPPMLRG